jgi:hypothetical protein
METYERTLHIAAIAVEGDKYRQYRLLFDEEGHILLTSKGMEIPSRQYDEACKTALEVAPEVQKKRRDFRALVRAEASVAEMDPRIPHPTERHSVFWQNGARFRRREIPRLRALGYQTVEVWEPLCKQDGCETYEWCLWPPYVPAEEIYVCRRVQSLEDCISGTVGWIPDLTNVVTQVVPEGTVYSGYLTMRTEGATAATGIHALIPAR